MEHTYEISYGGSPSPGGSNVNPLEVGAGWSGSFFGIGFGIQSSALPPLGIGWWADASSLLTQNTSSDEVAFCVVGSKRPGKILIVTCAIKPPFLFGCVYRFAYLTLSEA
jgi:hypothetical protein